MGVKPGGKRRGGVMAARRSPATTQGVGMVLGGAVSIQIGGALAVQLFSRMNPLGISWLRQVVAAIILCSVCRPKIRRLRRRDWLLLASFGMSLATMQGLIYLAIQRISLGAASTLDVLGPLVLSVLTGRRAVNVAWAVLAGTGVFLLSDSGISHLNLLGAVFAVSGGAVWAIYILLSARSAERFPKAEGLAIAMAIAALVSLPVGVQAAGGALLNPVTDGMVAALAAFATVVPYTLDNLALGKLPESTFGVLMSLDPALAAAAGFIILGQHLSPGQLLAIFLVMSASAGVVLTAPAKTIDPSTSSASA